MIWWDLRSVDEHPDLEAGHPPPGLLSSSERVVFDRLGNPRRRQDWLLGRWTAKGLVRAWLETLERSVPADAVCIASAPDGSPQAMLAGEGELPITLSIGHRDGFCLAALAEGTRAPLGADLERVEPRPEYFVEDFFTESERESLFAVAPGLRDRAVAEGWALKEAALKALRLGLKGDARWIETAPRPTCPPGWSPSGLHACLPSSPASRARAWCSDQGPYVLALAWLGETAQEPSESLRAHPVLDIVHAAAEAAYTFHADQVHGEGVRS